MSDDTRCNSYSEDGRRCHGDDGHFPATTHWAAASRIWTDTETLVRPVTTAAIAKGTLLRINGFAPGPIEIEVAAVEKQDDGSVVIHPTKEKRQS